MVMKFYRSTRALCLIIVLLTFNGCKTNQVVEKHWLDTQGQSNVSENSERYLPVQQKDGETVYFLPYQLMVNPYLEIEKQLDKEVVQQFVSAKKYIRENQLQKAEAALKKVTQLDGSLSGPWVLLGEIAQQQSKSEQAIMHFEQAIRVNNDNVNAFLALAKSRRIQGQFNLAKQVYIEALKRWKDFPEAHLNLGVLYDVYLNEPTKAQRHIEAYLFLVNGDDNKAKTWLDEIQSRTGLAFNLPVDKSTILSQHNPERKIQ